VVVTSDIPRLTDHLLAKGVVQRGFVSGEVTIRFQVGPANQDFVSGFDLVAPIREKHRMLFEKAREDQCSVPAQRFCPEQVFIVMIRQCPVSTFS